MSIAPAVALHVRGPAPSLFSRDVDLPGSFGIEATRQIGSARPQVVISPLAEHSDGTPQDGGDGCGAAARVQSKSLNPLVLQERRLLVPSE
jgi:DNA-binding NarL/FixJ family response regulator